MPASGIFSSPCFHHLSSSLGFLVVLDGQRRTVETARLARPDAADGSVHITVDTSRLRGTLHYSSLTFT